VFPGPQYQGQRMMGVEPDEFGRKKSSEVCEATVSCNPAAALLVLTWPNGADIA